MTPELAPFQRGFACVALHQPRIAGNVGHVLDYLPHGAQIVAVDLVPGATELPRFQHPARAVYVFGPENGTLGDDILSRAHHRVSVPTRGCMNLAATVCVVLYDRMCKGAAFGPAFYAARRAEA